MSAPPCTKTSIAFSQIPQIKLESLTLASPDLHPHRFENTCKEVPTTFSANIQNSCDIKVGSSNPGRTLGVRGEGEGKIAGGGGYTPLMEGERGEGDEGGVGGEMGGKSVVEEEEGTATTSLAEALAHVGETLASYTSDRSSIPT